MKRVSWLQTVLLLGLLLSQLSQLVHASDVVAHTGSEACEACILSAGFDVGPASHDTGIPVPGLHDQDSGTVRTVIISLQHTLFHSRAPPEKRLTS
jgi:sugar (pentulose or hexulose) kinase